MMKRLFTSFCLTGCLLGSTSLSTLTLSRSPLTPAIAQAQITSDLFYTFYGQRVPLTLRQDAIAVQFKPVNGTPRGNSQPLSVRLQQALTASRSTTRRGNPTPALPIEVNPLGERYALVTLPPGSRSTDPSLNQRIQQQSYVESTLPVLTRPLKTGDQSSTPPDSIVLSNEIILSLESKLSPSQVQQFLGRYDLELIRPLRFTQNRYLVRSRSAAGLSVLDLANQLNQTAGIQSATPNFVQALPYLVSQANLTAESDRPSPVALLQPQFTNLAAVAEGLRTTLLPLAWHLDSTAQRKRLPRTDIRAIDAWRLSQQGKGTVVAVIDSVIQWDHPDLAQSVYTVPKTADKLPGEIHGWDFASNDSDTRLSTKELAILSPHFRNTFTLSDTALLQQYSRLAAAMKQRRPDRSTAQLANQVRDYIRSNIAAEFHGTWTTGVIAAHPNDNNGAVGVAPNTQVLPVRVFGLGGEIQSAALIEAVGYAAARKVDVINMSLGGLLPDQELTSQIFDVLDTHPKLVIVASAGNESLDGAAFPAAIPGVVSVGATNLTGNRAFYSSFGGRLDVVAPGGETIQSGNFGILTTGGIGISGFWQGLAVPNHAWGDALDPMGNYVQVEGTSFSAPAVAGVLALMKGEDSQRRLTRNQLVSILKRTASYKSLNLSKADVNRYRLQAAIGFGTAGDFPFLRPSGVFTASRPVSPEQYFFGSGLVNAEAAVNAVKRSRQ